MLSSFTCMSFFHPLLCFCFLTLSLSMLWVCYQTEVAYSYFSAVFFSLFNLYALIELQFSGSVLSSCSKFCVPLSFLFLLEVLLSTCLVRQVLCWWTPLSFCLRKSLSLLHIWTMSLLDRVFLADGFYLLVFWDCHFTPSWPVGFLLRHLLLA